MLFLLKGKKVLTLHWGNNNFAMPLAVKVNAAMQKIAMPEGKARLVLPLGSTVEIDPEDWVLAHLQEGEKSLN